MADTGEFARLAEPFRPELLAHCYRMLGSVQDAEDVAQETYLRAWRSYGGFEGRSSLRQWLYRIATNACLRALEPDRRALLDRYVAAFETADGSALERLLREDVELEMPPFVTWFAGRQAVLRFFSSQVLAGPGQFRVVPTTANGQPAAAAYLRGRDGVHRAHAVQVLSLTPTGIARIVVFLDPGLFATLGLPLSYRGSPVAAPAVRP